jgi:hypothetical protein
MALHHPSISIARNKAKAKGTDRHTGDVRKINTAPCNQGSLQLGAPRSQRASNVGNKFSHVTGNPETSDDTVT